jgi:hypothetical protein
MNVHIRVRNSAIRPGAVNVLQIHVQLSRPTPYRWTGLRLNLRRVTGIHGLLYQRWH